jgi:hypothetical protein
MLTIFFEKGLKLTTDKCSTRLLKQALMSLMITAFVIYAAYLIQAIYVDRALYADGANFFVELLTKTISWPVADDSKHIRLFVNIINQFPLVLALKSGIDELNELRLFFGAGLFLAPICFYFYCYTLSRRAGDFRVFYFAVINVVTCAIPSDMFILNQAFTSLALSWIVVHYLLLNLKIKWFDWAIIFSVSIVLFRAHESLIIWGGIFSIGAICSIFFRKKVPVNNRKSKMYFIGTIGLCQSIFVAYWQYSHPVGEQTSEFLKLITLLKPSEIWLGNTKISVLMTIALVLIFLWQSSFTRRLAGMQLLKKSTSVILLFISGWMLFTGVSSLYDFNLTDPVREFEYRFLITFGSAGWMLLAIAYVLYGTPITDNLKSLYKFIICIGIISASSWQISNNIQWTQFSKTTSQILQNSSSSIIDPNEVRIKLAAENNENAYKYRWGWTWPVLGMSLQNEWLVNKIYKPDGYEEYFNPPKRIPFIPMSGGEIGNNGPGLYRFENFTAPSKGKL